jgi:glutamine synthetase adenylyltransferase
MNPRPKDQFSGTNVLTSIMNKVSAAIEKRFETPKSKEHKEWNAAIEDKRKQKKQLKKLNRLKKTDADTAIAALIKEHSADVSEAIRNNIIKTHETHKNNLMKAENEPDRN